MPSLQSFFPDHIKHSPTIKNMGMHRHALSIKKECTKVDIRQESLKKHYEWQGKIEVVSRAPINTREELSLAYTPGVAEPCLVIQKDYDQSFALTRRHNLVAVITDGTAVLGLGDIGPEAGMPVMEGKCALFKEFAGVDAFPLCIRSKDVDELVRTIYLISGSFGGINLEDISAPRCFEVERRLKEICDIPVFHDDQHGTAVVVAAALLNALKVVKKPLGIVRAVINGAGSAGIAIAKHLLNLGHEHLVMVDRFGIIDEGMAELNPAQAEMALQTNRSHLRGSLKDALQNADVFIGVSAPNVVTAEMIRSMASGAIVFAMANPVPEIMPDLAKAAGARVAGTGRSDFPNQINNVLAFPGIFRGALDCRATAINEEMKVAASHALAELVSDSELNEDYILPNPLDKRVSRAVADAVMRAARETGVARK
jgi:malate dehydrogenase (oxaloacetate-decarboxylating)